MECKYCGNNDYSKWHYQRKNVAGKKETPQWVETYLCLVCGSKRIGTFWQTPLYGIPEKRT